MPTPNKYIKYYLLGWHGTYIITEPSRYGPLGSVHEALKRIKAIHPQSRRGHPQKRNTVW